jgi:hypothetical protein
VIRRILPFSLRGAFIFFSTGKSAALQFAPADTKFQKPSLMHTSKPLFWTKWTLYVLAVFAPIGFPSAAAGPAEGLFSAASGGDAAAVQALLAKGAELNAKNNDGVTALIVASGNGHLDVVQALLAKGAELNAKNNDGATALMLASYNGTSMWCKRCSPRGPMSMPRITTAGPR